ncbi:MAG: IS4 family transposase [Dethiobacter sp.]|jgi:hypothetical protein|nr:MAG: IS4 family transposase [Dethiobacter sp.]
MDENHWAYEEFKNLGINCGRTIKRFIRTMITLSGKIRESIAGASDSKAEAKAMYRLIENKKVTEEVVLHAHRKATIQKMKESGETTILSIQDTTILNYTSHKKTKGLGDFGAGPDHKGLIVHSALAVTPKGIALGLLDQFIWTRDPEERGKRTEKRQKPIEEKESYKWLKSMDNSHSGIPKGIRLVHVGDREADIYEFFDHAHANKQDFLVRVAQNRMTMEACKLFDKVKQEPSAGHIVVEIPRDTRRNLPKREATLEIRYIRVHIQAPANTLKKFVKNRNVALSIVHVQELKPPEGVEPIEWYLVTSMDITNLDEAVEKVNWYIHRWKIERFHYILKSGCEIEKLQNRTAERIQKLILVYSIISVRILGMTYQARQCPEVPCTMFLEEEEWKVLYCMTNRTSTAPQTAPTIKEAVSYLAKLGGFLGRKGDGEPGAKVIWKGLNELNTVLKHYRYLSP